MDTADLPAVDPSSLVTVADHVASLLEMFDTGQMSIGAVLAVLVGFIVKRVLSRPHRATRKTKE